MTEEITATPPICGAQLRGKETGRVCQQTHVMPNGRCRLHGGMTPRGLASASLKSGRYSKDIPTQLLSTYERARTDVELLNLGDDIALAEARIGELLGKLSQQTALLEAAEQMTDQIRKGEIETPEKTIAKIQSTTETLKTLGTSLWAEVREAQEKKRKLVEAERRRLTQMQAFIDARQVMLMLTRFEDIILTRVSIPAEKAAIGRELQALVQDSLFMTATDQEERN